ncbi:hypothetical protein NP603_17440 [Methylomonas sp. SURF-1]|uniref:Uncharacterized protein n=1 Tax=Methylomonas aurea TaxID=2952224 RepID=A0ABT1UL01_9GAMM|nr:hypothetical protein [Methylomonas sp. SURF-1]MCQ8182911.1 hypothetical protein [Methylomonas sp. SURF-1]
MKKTHMMLIAAVIVLLGSTAAMNVTIANESGKENAKSVAWYVANIQAAKAQNQACHDNPNNQSNENCANALHALEISFKGGN